MLLTSLPFDYAVLLDSSDRVRTKRPRAAGVRVLKFPFESPKMNYGMYWHGRQTTDPAHTWLREVIIEAAKDDKRRR